MRDVYAAYLTTGERVEHSFLASLGALMAHDSRIIPAGPFRKTSSAGGLADARNELTADWLDHHSGADWLWFVDTDMGFTPDTLDAMLASAHPVDRPVLGALCFAWIKEQSDGRGGYSCRPQPTIYGYEDVGFRAASDYRRNAVMRVAGTGAACLLVHRSAAETVRLQFGDEWWLPVRYPDGRTVSEDLSFCYRLGQAGIPVHVDTSIRTTHAKTIWVGEEHWLAWRRRHE